MNKRFVFSYRIIKYPYKTALQLIIYINNNYIYFYKYINNNNIKNAIL